MNGLLPNSSSLFGENCSSGDESRLSKLFWISASSIRICFLSLSKDGTFYSNPAPVYDSLNRGLLLTNGTLGGGDNSNLENGELTWLLGSSNALGSFTTVLPECGLAAPSF